MIGDAVVKGFPTYQKTTTNWPNLEQDQGRVIIYFKRQGLKSFNPLGVGGNMYAKLIVDEKMETTLMDRTFVFLDLTTGQHTLDFKMSGFSKPVRIDIGLLQKTTSYVELDNNYTDKTLPKIVDESVAIDALQSLHYNFKNALPMNRQKEGVRYLGTP